MEELLALPLAVRVALALLVVVQLSLQLWSIIDLTRRPPAGGNRKLVWALVIVLGNLVGAIAYLAVGRKMLDDAAAQRDAALQDNASPSRADARARSLDRLYKDRDA